MSNDETKYVYRCGYEAGPDIRWDEVEPVGLSDTATGEAPRLSTIVRMRRSEAYVHVRFECEDDHVVATYENRDDPIYEEDVVEIFIDTAGEGTSYREYEFSPRGVIFDALIAKAPGQGPKVDTSWDDEGLLLRIERPNERLTVYDIALPIASMERPPEPGTTWRMNVYRIDDDKDGRRHFWAWSPTGAVNFHVPEKFGTVVFV
ncbi:carbohydrate-binding family 9-like protein [Paenibacillus flagellatus]|uniref:Carbohydrate-binding domain-containing protein n=1 Tax=Paenibacillus flagellatus TaxID=2211139 RepID=A0A2V5K9F1_9BACL|nr:carbohydrate-binding family 9-like protein [Paenibacillus flagellatus]PYI55482.1 hypothetical protein DLM86_07035 [Paenibacillus flagellatus]